MRGRSDRARAVPHPDPAPVRAGVGRGARAARAQRRHDPRGGRRRDPRLPERARAVRRRRRRRRRHPGALPARPVPRRSSPPRRRTYTQHARNPANSVQVGGDATVFAPNYGSPFVHDLDQGRRYATLADFENFVKLAYLHPYLHHSGGTVCEPVDVPVSKRHLDMVYAHLRYSDKPFMGSVTAGERAADSVELARIGFGGDLAGPHGDDEPDQRLVAARCGTPRCSPRRRSTRPPTRRRSSRRSSSPGRWRRRRRPGWPPRRSPRRSSGMAFTQLVRPGAPVIFGSFASSMSMQTGAPTFGTPEPAIVLYTMAALARRLGVPFRSGGSLTASKLPDAQAAVRERGDADPDDHGRHQLRAPRRRLAGGRARRSATRSSSSTPTSSG